MSGSQKPAGPAEGCQQAPGARRSGASGGGRQQGCPAAVFPSSAVCLQELCLRVPTSEMGRSTELASSWGRGSVYQCMERGRRRAGARCAGSGSGQVALGLSSGVTLQ